MMKKKLRFRLQTVKQITSIYSSINYIRYFIVYFTDVGEAYVDQEVEPIPDDRYRKNGIYSLEGMNIYLDRSLNKCREEGYSGFIVFRNHQNMLQVIVKQEEEFIKKVNNLLIQKQSDLLLGRAVVNNQRVTYKVNKNIAGWKTHRLMFRLAV